MSLNTRFIRLSIMFLVSSLYSVYCVAHFCSALSTLSWFSFCCCWAKEHAHSTIYLSAMHLYSLCALRMCGNGRDFFGIFMLCFIHRFFFTLGSLIYFSFVCSLLHFRSSTYRLHHWHIQIHTHIVLLCVSKNVSFYMVPIEWLWNVLFA